MIGTVKFYNAAKGFGFIQPEDGTKDAFVHRTALEAAGIANLNEGDKVEFEMITANGKASAGNLKKAS